MLRYATQITLRNEGLIPIAAVFLAAERPLVFSFVRNLLVNPLLNVGSPPGAAYIQ